jgi:hypothetical protein
VVAALAADDVELPEVEGIASPALFTGSAAGSLARS